MSTTTHSTNPSPLTAAPLAHDLTTELSKLPFDGEFARPLRGKSRRWLIKLGVAAAAVALLAWGVVHWLLPIGAAKAEITGTATKGTLLISVTERGELESSKSVDVRCEVEGRQIKIVEIVQEGTRVTKDQVVVRFDTEEITKSLTVQTISLKQAEGKAKAARGELEVQKNKAASEIAKAELALTLADLDRDKYLQIEYKVELEDRKGAIALAEKDLVDAQSKLDYYRKFVSDGFGTPEQLRSKEADLDKAKFSLDRDKAKLFMLEHFIRRRQETELTAKAADAKRELERTKSSAAASTAKSQSDWEAAEVTAQLEKRAVERLQKQLDKCVVATPQDGILVYSNERYWDVSNRIQVGGMVHFQQPLFKIPDLTQMQVKVKIHEALIKKVLKEQKAEIRVESLPNVVLHGAVIKVASMASNMSWDERGVKEYETVVRIDDLPVDAGLKPGMSAEVKILVNSFANVLMVPVQAVSEKAGKHYCYVKNASGWDKREVTVAENNEKFVEVKTGLAEGEAVALDARARLAAETKATEHLPEEPTPAKQPEKPKEPTVAKPKSPPVKAAPGPAPRKG